MDFTHGSLASAERLGHCSTSQATKCRHVAISNMPEIMRFTGHPLLPHGPIFAYLWKTTIASHSSGSCADWLARFLFSPGRLEILSTKKRNLKVSETVSTMSTAGAHARDMHVINVGNPLMGRTWARNQLTSIGAFPSVNCHRAAVECRTRFWEDNCVMAWIQQKGFWSVVWNSCNALTSYHDP